MPLIDDDRQARSRPSLRAARGGRTASAYSQICSGVSKTFSNDPVRRRTRNRRSCIRGRSWGGSGRSGSGRPAQVLAAGHHHEVPGRLLDVDERLRRAPGTSGSRRSRPRWSGSRSAARSSGSTCPMQWSQRQSPGARSSRRTFIFWPSSAHGRSSRHRGRFRPQSIRSERWASDHQPVDRQHNRPRRSAATCASVVPQQPPTRTGRQGPEQRGHGRGERRRGIDRAPPGGPRPA